MLFHLNIYVLWESFMIENMFTLVSGHRARRVADLGTCEPDGSTRKSYRACVIEILVGTFKVLVRQMEMDQAECARNHVFCIFAHILKSPSIHSYTQGSRS